MASFVLRDLDDAMWKKVKIKAATEGRTIKHVVVSLIEDWAEKPPRTKKS
jgi:plasmid stability protein